MTPELARHPSPVDHPQGIAWDGATMWLTSAATGRVYALDPQMRAVGHQFVPPAAALGITHTGADFRLVLAPSIDASDELDHRYVYRFSPHADFAECFVCPNLSGSFLAYDDGRLYLSQAWDKKLIELDPFGSSIRELELSRRPVGMTIVHRAFYLVTVDDAWDDGRFERLDFENGSEPLVDLPFKPRGVAFDGERFWIADRNDHALVSFALDDA